jgi:hypothetical protein
VNVHIEQTNAFTGHGQSCSKIHRYRTFAYAPFSGKHQNFVLYTAHPQKECLPIHKFLVIFLGMFAFCRAICIAAGTACLICRGHLLAFQWSNSD